MPLDSLLASLAARSLGVDPNKIVGGVPEITREDILAIASNARKPHFHMLMAKYCGDEYSRARIERWMLRKCIAEWFVNPAYQTVRLEARQLKKLSDLAVMCWLNPQESHAATLRTRAAFIGAQHDTYRNRFEPHYAFLLGELGHYEAVALAAVVRANREDDEDSP